MSMQTTQSLSVTTIQIAVKEDYYVGAMTKRVAMGYRVWDMGCDCEECVQLR